MAEECAAASRRRMFDRVSALGRSESSGEAKRSFVCKWSQREKASRGAAEVAENCTAIGAPCARLFSASLRVLRVSPSFSAFSA